MILAHSRIYASSEVGNGTRKIWVTRTLLLRGCIIKMWSRMLTRLKEHFDPVNCSDNTEGNYHIFPVNRAFEKHIKNHAQAEQYKKMPPNKLQRLLRINPNVFQSTHAFIVPTTRSKISSFCCNDSLQKILVASTPYSKIGLIEPYFFIGQHSSALLRSDHEYLEGFYKKTPASDH